MGIIAVIVLVVILFLLMVFWVILGLDEQYLFLLFLILIPIVLFIALLRISISISGCIWDSSKEDKEKYKKCLIKRIIFVCIVMAVFIIFTVLFCNYLAKGAFGQDGTNHNIIKQQCLFLL